MELDGRSEEMQGSRKQLTRCNNSGLSDCKDC